MDCSPASNQTASKQVLLKTHFVSQNKSKSLLMKPHLEAQFSVQACYDSLVGGNTAFC